MLLKALIPILALQCLAAPSNVSVPSSAPAVRITELYHFKPGTYVENIAVRANGDLVVVLLSQPEVYSIPPTGGTARLVHRFKGQSRVTGIVEIAPDVFAVAVGKMVHDTIPKAWSIWAVDFRTGAPVVNYIAKNVKGAGLLNGLELLNPSTLLVSDTMKGVIWSVDIRTGESGVLLKSSLVKKIPNLSLGINGIHLRGSTLYTTNTADGIAKIPIDTRTGRQIGRAEMIDEKIPGYDDFAISPSGDALYIANQIVHGINRVDLVRPGPRVVVAGGLERGKGGFVSPTSVVFGRTPGYENTMFVTTAGKPLIGKGPPDGGKGGKVIAVTLL